MDLSVGSFLKKALPALILFLLLYSPAAAQTDLEFALKKAEQFYNDGQWDQAIELIQRNLNSENLTEKYKSKFFRLLGLVYISVGLEIELRDAVKNFLLVDPGYKINLEQDPPALQQAIDNIAPTLVPNLLRATPKNFSRSESEVRITVSGNNFSRGSVIQFDGNDLPTEYISSEKMIGTITPGEFPEQDKYEVRVYSPILGGKFSNSLFVTSGVTQSNRVKISLNGALSLPLGDFAEDTEDESAGFATLGFGILGDITVPIGPAGLGWISTLGLVYNGYDDSYFEKKFAEMGYDVDNDVSGYYNIPVMTGIGYTIIASPGFNLNVNAQIGISIINGPGIQNTFENIDYSGDMEYSYDMSTSFSFGIGFGIAISERFSAGIRYLNMGNPEREATINLSLRDNFTGHEVTDSQSETFNQSISVLLITVGFIF